jgi:RHS repeat-associated protein
LSQTGTFASTYTISGSNNQIVSTSGNAGRTYSYDAAGNTLGYNGTVNFTYNNRGRMVQASAPAGSSPYVYNALGQLIETDLSTVGVRLFMDDEAGHYLGVYNGSGGLGDETVWLGDLPVAMLVPNGSSVTIYYVHSDQSYTPRQVTRPSDNTQMWTWFSDPFGTTAQNENPQGNGTLNYPPRFPGQMSAAGLAGLIQNWNRDYDPVVARYVESDLIGLQGGVNTYTYVLDNPVSGIDPEGLTTTVTVRCGRLAPSMGGSVGSVHCEVVAYCDKTGERLAFGIGGGGNGIWQRLFGGKTPPKYPASSQPRGVTPDPGQKEYAATCGNEADCGCPNMKCLKSTFANVTPPPYYALWQNSNSFAHFLLNQCGCSSPRPSGAVAW